MTPEEKALDLLRRMAPRPGSTVSDWGEIATIIAEADRAKLLPEARALYRKHIRDGSDVNRGACDGHPIMQAILEALEKHHA